MKYKILWLLFTTLVTTIQSLPAQTNDYSVTVSVESLKSSKGKILALLFDQSESFPGEVGQAIHETEVDIQDKQATFSFSGLAKDRYAISIVHDENGNGRMDTNFLGIPNEGYGASNDAKGNMGPPAFEDAAFQVNRADLSLQINMRY